MTKTVGYFVLLSIEGTTPELHASGCRDLHGFNESPVIAESGQSALDGLVEAGTLTADAKVRIMPCTNPVRMRYINRLFEVDAETGAKVSPEPVVEETPVDISLPEPTVELVPEETPAPAVSKSAAKKLRKAAKKAAKVAEAVAEAEVA